MLQYILHFLKDGSIVSVVDSVLVKESTRQYDDCRDSLPVGVCYTLLTNNAVSQIKEHNHGQLSIAADKSLLS